MTCACGGKIYVKFTGECARCYRKNLAGRGKQKRFVQKYTATPETKAALSRTMDRVGKGYCFPAVNYANNRARDAGWK